MTILRWTLLIPFAIAVGWLGQIVLYYPNLWMIEWHLWPSEPNFFAKIYLEIMGSSGWVFGFILGGANMAPDNKNKTASVLCVLIMASASYSIYLGYGKNDWWLVSTSCLAIMESLGVIYITLTSSQDAKEIFSLGPWNRNS